MLDTSRGTISSNQVARINATFGILAGGVIDSHVSSKRENCSTIRLACYSYARLMINRRSHAEMKSLSSVCLCVYLSVCLSVCLPVCLSLFLSLFLTLEGSNDFNAGSRSTPRSVPRSWFPIDWMLGNLTRLEFCNRRVSVPEGRFSDSIRWESLG